MWIDAFYAKETQQLPRRPQGRSFSTSTLCILMWHSTRLLKVPVISDAIYGAIQFQDVQRNDSSKLYLKHTLFLFAYLIYTVALEAVQMLIKVSQNRYYSIDPIPYSILTKFLMKFHSKVLPTIQTVLRYACTAIIRLCGTERPKA